MAFLCINKKNIQKCPLETNQSLIIKLIGAVITHLAAIKMCEIFLPFGLVKIQAIY
jgi:hypothetical protein